MKPNECAQLALLTSVLKSILAENIPLAEHHRPFCEAEEITPGRWFESDEFAFEPQYFDAWYDPHLDDSLVYFLIAGANGSGQHLKSCIRARGVHK